MRLFQPVFLSLSLASVVVLAACSNSTPTTSSPAKTSESKPIESGKAMSTPSATKTDNHGTPQKGGQVIESGIYHLELVVAPEEKGIHLDFFLQKGDNHEAIPDAKVTAQVQMPDGTQKSLDLTYDTPAKHYAVTLPAKTTGEYKVVILSDIKGEKVNGRFNFKI